MRNLHPQQLAAAALLQSRQQRLGFQRDRMRDDAFINLVKVMNERPAITRQALDALLVSRNLERVADHATNIAEDVIFWVRGADVRHHMLENESKPAN